MLNNHFDCPQGHIAARDFICCPRSPIIRRYRLEELLNSREQLDRIQRLRLQIIRYVASQFPDAFEDQLCDFGFSGLGAGTIHWEWFDDLK